MDVAVLGHRGMLGSVVARYFAEQRQIVHTTELRYDGGDDLPLWASQFDATVNCIRGGWLENAVLPHHLADLSRHYIIQPSTDAWRERTIYGRAKWLGEPPDAIVIRSGLVDIRRQPSVAFTNWLCNPLTPLEWAHTALAYTGSEEPSVTQAGREPLTRFEVAQTVAEVFGGPTPEAAEAPEPNDRLVHSEKWRPPLVEALTEYRDWLG